MLDGIQHRTSRGNSLLPTGPAADELRRQILETYRGTEWLNEPYEPRGKIDMNIEQLLDAAGVTDPDERAGVIADVTDEVSQHRKVKGYRDLSETEIAVMNAIKEKGAELGELVETLRGTEADQRWISIGATHLQIGLMTLTRGVTKPEFF